jgi:hypothetical protein
MKKSILETFIKKYNLNGNIEHVKLVVDGTQKQLRTSSITEDKNAIADVKLNDFTALDAMEIGIYDTATLKQMLGVLGDEIEITANTKNDKITSLTFSDESTQIQYVTADLVVIPKSPSMKKIPEINVEIEVNNAFITKFIRSKNALPDVDKFTLCMSKKNKLEMVVGHGKNNTNRITLSVTTLNNKESVSKSLSFSATYLKEILTSNNECESAILKVSDSGLATIEFVNGNFISSYYLIEIKDIN